MAETTTGRGRFEALDGLRGIAALIVLVHHSLLTVPALAPLGLEGGTEVGGVVGAVSSTPLSLLWAGGEAVILFFVLSGLVLSLPFLRRPPDLSGWLTYYPRRLLRLYLPVWGSLVLAGVIVAATYRSSATGLGWWMDFHRDYEVTPRLAFENATLSVPNPFGFNSVLWSLHFEVVFSMLLPVYLLVATRMRRYAGALALGVLAVIGAANVADVEYLRFLPVFALGVLMATRLDDVRAALVRIGARGRVVVLAVGVLLLTSHWWLPLSFAVNDVLRALAAVLVVVSFLPEGPGVRIGTTRVVQWLGVRSFSLYLVHEPIVVAGAFVAPGLSPWVRLPLTAVVALVVAASFFRLVERPSHRLVKLVRVGGRSRQGAAA